MDVLSSCQITRARIGEEGTNIPARLKWYKCQPGAKAFPGWHAFGATCWEPMPWEWTRGPGIYPFGKEWTPSNIQAPPGTEYHGKQAWFERGIPQSVWDHPADFIDPNSQFCFTPKLGAVSGIVLPSPNLLGVVTGVQQPTAYLLGMVTATVQPASYLLGVVTASSSTAADPLAILAGVVSSSSSTTADPLAILAGVVSGTEATVSYTMALDAGVVSGATSTTTDPTDLTAGVVSGATASGTTAFLFPGAVAGVGFIAGGWSGESAWLLAGTVAGLTSPVTDTTYSVGEVSGVTSSVTSTVYMGGEVTGLTFTTGSPPPPPIGDDS